VTSRLPREGTGGGGEGGGERRREMRGDQMEC